MQAASFDAEFQSGLQENVVRCLVGTKEDLGKNAPDNEVQVRTLFLFVCVQF